MPAYRLVDGAPQPDDDLEGWAEWMESSVEERVIASSSVGPAVITTLFYGYSPPDVDPPEVYMTSVLGGYKDGACCRYQTRQQAVFGHAWCEQIVSYFNR